MCRTNGDKSAEDIRCKWAIRLHSLEYGDKVGPKHCINLFIYFIVTQKLQIKQSIKRQEVAVIYTYSNAREIRFNRSS